MAVSVDISDMQDQELLIYKVAVQNRITELMREMEALRCQRNDLAGELQKLFKEYKKRPNMHWQG